MKTYSYADDAFTATLALYYWVQTQICGVTHPYKTQAFLVILCEAASPLSRYHLWYVPNRLECNLILSDLLSKEN